MKTELHCHTKLSDGSCTFNEILDMAVREGICHLAITNHDTTLELKEMVRKGLERKIEIIPGIEISAFDFKRNRKVHILGYFIEPGNTAIEKLCAPLIEQRHHANCKAVERLVEAGYSITWDNVLKYAEGGTGVYKQHIVHALIDQGYTTEIYGDLYKKLFSRGQNGKPPGIAYIPMEYVDAGEAVRTVLQAGGVPVLAHPGQYQSFEVIPELVEKGLQGIEVWHPLHGPDEEAKALECAQKYNLVITGGSDFHGFYGERQVVLGSKCPGLAAVNALKSRSQTH